MSWSWGQKYFAEFLGTFGLLLSVGGAAVFSGVADDSGAARVILIAAALAFGVLGMIYAFGDVSGAHFNPAVTIGFWVSGRFPGRQVVPYIIAQLLGGVVATGIVAAVAWGGPSGTFSFVQMIALASQGYSGNGAPYAWSLTAVFLLEVTFTFFLVLVILFATRSENSSKNLAPIGIALTLLMTNLVAIPVDGASVNPARSFAPAILSAAWSSGQWAIKEDWLFWVAPIIGGIVAALVDRAMRARPGTA
ncbi:MAG: aquaporin [Thermoplasmata archaeon]|nr:aquaporin [Thermoplasmata archaeon]